ncbi:MAG: hypothetical protein F6J93_37735 [Oscillatoria sp. SIO1A7]|nr:hypothetical protein [Oscillatoria sp. SIO1A7]
MTNLVPMKKLKKDEKYLHSHSSGYGAIWQMGEKYYWVAWESEAMDRHAVEIGDPKELKLLMESDC